MRARTKHFLRSWRTFAGWGVFDGCEKKIDDKEAAYSDYEIRRKQEKIMDIFYEFGELMNLDPCDEKVQKAAEELHEITGGQKQVVIEILNDKYWKKAVRVAGGNGSLEFARKVMREFYQTRYK